MRHTTIVIGLIAALCCRPCLANCTKDALELDYNASTGVVIAGGTFQQRNFCDDAEDWVSVPVCPGRSYSLDTSAIGAAADTLIELYAGDGTTLLAVDGDPGPDPSGHLAWTETSAARGTLHARIRQRDGTNGDLRDYRIKLTGDTSPCTTDVIETTAASDVPSYLSSIVQSVDGGFVTAGSFGDAPIAVTRWDVDGTIRWIRTIGVGPPYSTHELDIARTADGGFLVSRHDGKIAKFTDAGVCSWQKNYSENFPNIAAARDGSIYTAGYGSTVQGRVFGSIMKLNAFGDKQWAILVGDSDRSVILRDVQPLANGGAVTVGYTDADDAGLYDGVLVEVSATSVITRQSFFHAAGVWTFFNLVRSLGADGYLVGGDYCPDGGATCRAILLRLSAAGAIVWQRTLVTPHSDSRMTSIGTFPDGSIYAGLTTFDGQLETVMNTRWTVDGKLLWQSSLSTGPDANMAGMVTDDGGIAVAFGGGFETTSPLSLVRAYSTGNTSSCIAGSSTAGIPGSSTLAVATSSLYSLDNYVEAFATSFLIASKDHTSASVCCSRVLGPPIFVTGKVSTVISWANDGFGPYDLVRGDLATLGTTHGDFTAALNAIPPGQQCLAQDDPDGSATDDAQPPSGTGYFYLVRGANGSGLACASSYDESVSQQGARDAEISAASGSCP